MKQWKKADRTYQTIVFTILGIRQCKKWSLRGRKEKRVPYDCPASFQAAVKGGGMEVEPGTPTDVRRQLRVWWIGMAGPCRTQHQRWKTQRTTEGLLWVFSGVRIRECVGGKSHLKGLESSACVHQPDWKKSKIPRALSRKLRKIFRSGY